MNKKIVIKFLFAFILSYIALSSLSYAYSNEIVNYSSEFKSGYITGAIFAWIFVPFVCYELSKYKELKSTEEKPLSWYKFYNYFVIPFSILLNITLIINQLRIHRIIIFNIFIVIATIIFMIMEFDLFICMLKKKKRTFNLLIVLMCLKCGIVIFIQITNIILHKVDKYEFIQLIPDISNVVYTLIWIILNILYFKKRKDIFIN